MNTQDFDRLSRRALLKYGGAALLVGCSGLRPRTVFGQQVVGDTGCGAGGEHFPTSPLILDPFRDPLPIPRALAPVPVSQINTWPVPPGRYNQDSLGNPHQVWPTDLGLPEPLVYKIKVQVNDHRFTSSLVQPINEFGVNVRHPLTLATGPQILPASTIYGYNGTFPGAMINAEYGRPIVVRFENELHVNPRSLDRTDFGSPNWTFHTHLHNAHTAPESDGNPLYAGMHLLQPGYLPGQWCDNMYLNWACDNDNAEKQSFLWFHDHVMDHTGANVYKGLVGLYPIYDPVLDPGDETARKGLRLPGVRTNRPDGAFDVAYDIPLALFDCALDDGVIGHQDAHNGCGEPHPEWWGQKFFRHYPNHGFVGDIFTVNGAAYPVLEVKRRKYRLRFLNASVARIYDLQLMSSSGSPVASRDAGRIGPEMQGQYQLPDGQQCMQFVQIATDGGLLPYPIVRDDFELWPAKRREVVVDFTRYMDGTPTTKGDVIYLVNTMKMTNGRKPDDVDPSLPPYRVPMLKIVIGDLAPDQSVMPTPKKGLRAMPRHPRTWSGVPRRQFLLERSSGNSEESAWVINGLPFDPMSPIASPVRDSGELWTLVNGGGGWVHPMHLHMEEHVVISRNGVAAPDARHPDDMGREDVVALDPGEEVVIYRKFRTFTGPYVGHCHNLAHEDHAMMFGWSIV
jgi:FtsP/CotA-like multicopper oxidase with cupredoxin domain